MVVVALDHVTRIKHPKILHEVAKKIRDTSLQFDSRIIFNNHVAANSISLNRSIRLLIRILVIAKSWLIDGTKKACEGSFFCVTVC